MSLLLLALALSMDVFAAALSRGVSAPSGSILRTALTVAAALGAAHGLMPLVGWSLTSAMDTLVRDLDHWVAFALLVLIGVRMLLGERTPDGATGTWNDGHGHASLIVVALATSVDAAVVGGTFAGLGYSVVVACGVIAAVAFMFAIAGVYVGKAAGDATGRRAQVIGGLILIALAIKIVIEHEFLGG